MRWNGNSSAAPDADTEALANGSEHRELARALDDIGEVLTAAVIGFILGAFVAALCMVMLKWPPV